MTNDTRMALKVTPTKNMDVLIPKQRKAVRMPSGALKKAAAASKITLDAEKYSLPSPPDDKEKYAYLGKQKRWVLVLLTLSYGVIITTVLRFALLMPETYPFLIIVGITVAAAVLGMATSTRKRRFSGDEHRQKVKDWAPSNYPSVDVFLPSAGEPLDVLANTFKHVALMEWAGDFNVHVLDDANSEDVRVLANRYGFHYKTRPNRGELKKAGNLRYGYENSTGDLIVVFDADFVPRHDFLAELVPYFDDTETGIVQSPQYFDTDDRMSWLQRGAGSTQEYFYRWVQPSRNAVQAAICVGTNAIYRRSALDTAGGFAQIGHSEDVHTGVKLKKAGYVTQYVQVLVAKGLCPEDLGGFLNQQYRWCTGSMSLLRDKKFHKSQQMNFKQKLCFWSGFSYYLTTALFVFTVPLPTILRLWFLPGWITPVSYLPLLPSVLMALFLTRRLFHSQWRLEVLRVQQAYSYAHALAVWDTIRGKTASWVPTGATGKGTPLAVKLRRMMLVWIISTQVAMWGGLIYASVGHGFISHIPGFLLVALTAYIQVPLLLKVRTPLESAKRRAEIKEQIRAKVKSLPQTAYAAIRK